MAKQVLVPTQETSSLDVYDPLARSDFYQMSREVELAKINACGPDAPKSISYLRQEHVDIALENAKVLVSSVVELTKYCSEIIATPESADRLWIQCFLVEIACRSIALSRFLKAGLKEKYSLAHPECCTRTIGGVSSGNAHELVMKLAAEIAGEAWNVVTLHEVDRESFSGTVLMKGVLVAVDEEDPQKRPVFHAKYLEQLIQVVCRYSVSNRDEIWSWLEWEAGKVKSDLSTANPDGPCGINQWCYQGKVLDGRMTQNTCILAEYLRQRRGKKVLISDLVGTNRLFEAIQDETVKRHGSNVSKWFAERDVPIVVSSGDGCIWMEVN